MAVEVIVTDKKYNCEFINGLDFETNKNTEYSPNLIGSVMERIKYRQTFTIEWRAIASSTYKFKFDNSGDTTVLSLEAGTWDQYGLSQGDLLDITVNIFELVTYYDYTIQSYSPNVIVLDKKLPLTLIAGELEYCIIRAKNDLSSIYYKFGIIENEESTNYINKVSKNDQGFYAQGIGEDTGGGRSTDFVEMTPLGSFGGWRTGTARIRFVERVSDYIQKFEIEHDFIILPYYREGDIFNLQNNVNIELFEGFNTLKYVNEINMRKSIS